MNEATVIVAAWNASDTIEAAIASAAQQTDVEVETVVIDDRSEDDTVQRAQAAGARVERMSRNGGPSAARNRALDLAQGTWVAVLDSDDTMRPGRLRNMIAQAEKHGANVVLGNLATVQVGQACGDERPFLTGPRYAAPRQLTLEDYLEEDQSFADDRSLGYLKPLIRTEFLRRHGVRYDTRLRNGEDCHLILDCFAKGARVLFSPEPDYLYTVRPGSISHRADPGHIAALVAADRDYAERNAAILSPKAKILMARRLASLQSLAASESILRDIKARRAVKALKGFVRNRSAWFRVFRQLREAMQKRSRSGARTWKL